MNIFADFICENINNVFKSSLIPTCLKSADVAPVHKKVKGNYRLLSILPILSKVIERTIFAQMSEFLRTFYLHNNAASGKVIVRNIVFWLLEKWKCVVDRSNTFRDLLTACLRLLIVSTMDFLQQNLTYMG